MMYRAYRLQAEVHTAEDEMLGRALSYLVLFSTLGIILRWSVGVKLLSVTDDPVEPILADEAAPKALNGSADSNTLVRSPPALEPENQPLLLQQDQDVKRRSARFPEGTPMESEEHTNPGSIEGAQRKKARTDTGDYFRSFPNTPTWRTPATSSKGSSEHSDEEDEDAEGEASSPVTDDSEWGAERGTGMRSGTKPARSKFQSRMRKMRKFVVKWVWTPMKKTFFAIRSFMTVPLRVHLTGMWFDCLPSFRPGMLLYLVWLSVAYLRFNTS